MPCFRESHVNQPETNTPNLIVTVAVTFPHTHHTAKHQQSPRHSWSCLTEIDLFCYGPVNPLRKAAIIMARLHMGDSNPNVKLNNTSTPGEHSDHMTVRMCSAQRHSDARNSDRQYHTIIMLCDFVCDMCCAAAEKTTV